MNMSRANRRLLVCRALVLGVLEACRAASGVSASPEGVRILERLERLADDMARQLSGGRATLELPPAAQRAYLSTLEEVKSHLLAGLPEQVVASRYVAAVLVWVEDAATPVEPGSPRRRVLSETAEALQALLDLLGAEQGVEEVDQGVLLGEGLKQASGVWA